MSARTLRMVLLTLGALVLVYVVVLVWSSRPPSLPEGQAALVAALDQVDAGSVETVEITGGGESITLRRAAGGWTVNGFPADTVAATRVVDAISGASVASLVSSNPENHARLGVSGESARELRVVGGGSETTLRVGSEGPGSQSTYVKLPDSDDVFLITTGLRTAINRTDLGQWRDRTVVRVDTATVARVRVERDGVVSDLVRADTSWTVNGQAATRLPVTDLLGGIAGLIGVGFAPDSVSVDPVTRRIVALSATGDTLASIEMGATTDMGRVPTRVPGVDGSIELSEFQADRITPTLDRLTGN